MRDKKRFNSALAPYFALYLDEQQKKGIKNTSGYVGTFRSFDTYLTVTEHKGLIITEDVYSGWLDSQDHLKALTRYSNACCIIRFLKFMNELGHGCCVPRPPKAEHCDFVPFVFSDDEFARILKATDEWRDMNEQPNSCALVVPSIVRLMYSTGMRIGEALSINNRDIDFDRRVIHVHDTKNKCDRLSPINESLEKVLRQYIDYRNRMPMEHIADPDAPFFVNLRGKRCHEATILNRFHLILDKAGIQVASNGYRARLHDIRHTACVHAMSKLVMSGMDIYCSLPLLAAFMGHLHVKDTEDYVRLTRDMYPELISQDLSVTSSIRDVIINAAIDEANGIL